MRFLGQRQMTINHSTVTSTSMILTSGPLAPQIPRGMQVGLDVCLHMPSYTRGTLSLRDLPFLQWAASKMLHQPSRLLSVSTKMRANQGKEQSEFLCSWHPWQECTGWMLGTQDGLTLLVETSLR